jgi:hypothetical protein
VNHSVETASNMLKEDGAEGSIGVIYSVTTIPLYLLATFPNYSFRRGEVQLRTEARTEEAQLRPTSVAVPLSSLYLLHPCLSI